MRNRNIETDHLSAVMAMLGPAPNRYADPAAWDRLHAELGIRLPADYQVLVDAYAPVQLNHHLYLHHPATERWNLGRQIRDTVRAWSEVEWDGLDPDEDPRLLFGLEELSFGTPQGLWPIASTDRGETVFLVAAARPPPGSWSRTGRSAGRGTTWASPSGSTATSSARTWAAPTAPPTTPARCGCAGSR